MATTLPPIGLGTSGMDDPDGCNENVRTAIEAGYGHVDTAQLYGNEASVDIAGSTATARRGVEPDSNVYPGARRTLGNDFRALLAVAGSRRFPDRPATAG